MLATMDIKKKIEEDGNEITAEGGFSTGLLSHPENCESTLKARSKQAEQLLADGI